MPGHVTTGSNTAMSEMQDLIGTWTYLTECTCRSSCWTAGLRRSRSPSAITSLPEEASTTAAMLSLTPAGCHVTWPGSAVSFWCIRRHLWCTEFTKRETKSLFPARNWFNVWHPKRGLKIWANLWKQKLFLLHSIK